MRIRTTENVPFYNTKKPIIRMTYLESGQKRFREENFNIMHAQNISPTTGFNVDYKARGTRGQYVWITDEEPQPVGRLQPYGQAAIRCMRPITTTTSNSRRTAAWSGHGAIADTTFQMPSACR